MIEIHNKYNIGDEVYSYYRENYKVSCPFCNGTGEMQSERVHFKCIGCHGSGLISSPTTYVKPCKVNIRRIKASIGKDLSQSIRYTVDCLTPGVACKNRTQENLFETEEQAQNYCNQINEQEIRSSF